MYIPSKPRMFATLSSVGGAAQSLVISSQVAVQDGYGQMEKQTEDILVMISFQFPLVGDTYNA